MDVNQRKDNNNNTDSITNNKDNNNNGNDDNRKQSKSITTHSILDFASIGIDLDDNKYTKFKNNVNIQSTVNLVNKLKWFSLLLGIIVSVALMLYVELRYKNMISNIEIDSAATTNKSIYSTSAPFIAQSSIMFENKMKAINLEQWLITGCDIFLVILILVLLCLWSFPIANTIFSLLLYGVCFLIVGLALGLHITRFFLPSSC